MVFSIGFKLSIEEGDKWTVIREGYATFITKTLFKLRKDQLEYESTTNFESVKVFKDGVEMVEDQELLLDFFSISLSGILYRAGSFALDDLSLLLASLGMKKEGLYLHFSNDAVVILGEKVH